MINKTLNNKSIKEQVEFLKILETKFDKKKIMIILSHIKGEKLNPNDKTDLIIMELCIRKIKYSKDELYEI